MTPLGSTHADLTGQTFPSLRGEQWVCVVCDGAEESAPGFDPPDSQMCHTCARQASPSLVLAGLMGRPTVAALLDAVEEAGPACRPADAVTFTGPDAFEDEPDADRLAREETAMAVCVSCPARSACLDYALAVQPREGVWGGYTAQEITGFILTAARNEVA